MTEPFQSHAPKRQRRQYQSCDNCRKGRRACNAVSLGINPLQPNSAGAGTAAIACSTCQRSKKECTFRWLQELPRGTLPECLKQKFSRRYQPVRYSGGDLPASRTASQSHPQNVAGSDEMAENRTIPASGAVVRHKNGPRQTRIAPRRDQLEPNIIDQQATSLSEQGMGSAPNITADCANWLENVVISTSPFDYSQGQEFWWSGPPNFSDQQPKFDDSGQSATFASWDSPLYGALLGYPQSNNEGPDYGVDELNRDTSYPLSHTDTVHHSQASGDLALLTDTMLENNPSCPPQISDDVTFNMREFDLTQSFSKGLISDRLLSIYHDSFENSLSCWVTESNCPYKIPRLLLGSPTQRRKLLSYQASTRFYQRVRRLDNAFSPLRRQPLSRGDCARASKALMLAIMAFASQWTHSRDGHQRSRSLYSEADVNQPHQTSGKDFSDINGKDPYDFERLIRQSLWNEAVDAVHCCFNVDSFELIFAQIIFSITERPSHFDKMEGDEHSRFVSSHGNVSSISSALASNPGDQVTPSADRRRKATVGNERYLEIALHHLLAWKRRISSARRQQTVRAQFQSGNTPTLSRPILLEDYQAFDMFFWFGVMCDTTSAVLSDRVPVIPDSDSVFSLDDGQTASRPAGVDVSLGRHNQPQRDTTSKASVWGSCLTNALPSLFGAPAVRWPWPQGVAERMLQAATPVKVLLWRKITVIKALLSKETTPPSVIERCIAETLRVYEHWQERYGEFILDCISNHAHLSFKIQSWYVILASHWHLAALLVARYIGLVDVTLRSETVQRSLRQSSALVLELQKANAYAIANLARVAKPQGSNLSNHEQPFHYASAYGALVTEPWPEVLNQTLTRACEVLLVWLSSTKQPNPAPISTTSQQVWISANTSVSELTRHSTSCIEALNLLGSSSQLAQLAAFSLETRLKSLNEPLPAPQTFDLRWQDFGYDNLVY
ncbi:uncharacterized protein Z519_04609 [Cladophialophora bantiana CBS 173.52]|uniref:Zn(2)-C6 fungal-type domain-containing protein n=1 Tax=Cladophialophora bantiana (strain ATCC 10958 / CBS 173.52 / CDC B-1940 / NIH 8579) TaxID=1442370 RepID=A0A0D2HMP2_CLAB1|nr:uncharacterized protein Z519_04609 [Cladophialophora bantiana CBS 173.52]KIW94633.1 hypothetical protein Z519_04609 [Cladophialophora bantiana CBS 173.52]